MTDAAAGPVIRLGVSASLLGERVRYDGGHKRDLFLLKTLGRYVQWVPVCPEMEIGLGVPRPSLRLVETGAGVRMVAPKSGADHTETMQKWAKAHMPALERARLHGFAITITEPGDFLPLADASPRAAAAAGVQTVLGHLDRERRDLGHRVSHRRSLERIWKKTT